MPSRKPPVSAWIISERKRKGWKVADLSSALKAAGYDAEPSTVGVWEAGRKPRGETIEGLERIFGSSAPRDEPQPTDMAVLLAKMDRQTDAIEAVAKALLELITRLDRDQALARQERAQIAELVGIAARAPSLAERPSAVGRTRQARRP